MIQDSIEVSIPKLPAILGCAKAEREKCQDIAVDLELFIDTSHAGKTGELRDCLDYVRILGELRFIMKYARYYLIETAAQDLCKFMLAPRLSKHDQVSPDAIILKITKPHALSGFAVPALKVTRSFQDMEYASQKNKPYGMQRVLVDSCDVRLAKVVITPGASLSKAPRSAVMALSAGLTFEATNQKLSDGDVLTEAQSGKLFNDSEQEQTILVLQTKDKHPYETTEDSKSTQMSRSNYFEPVINQYVERLH